MMLTFAVINFLLLYDRCFLTRNEVIIFYWFHWRLNRQQEKENLKSKTKRHTKGKLKKNASVQMHQYSLY